MEGQLLYFSYFPKEDVWKIKSIPVSQAYIDSIRPSSPSRSRQILAEWNVMESLIEELGKLLSKNDGVEGWKLHWLGDLEMIDVGPWERRYGAKAILTRLIKPPAPPETSVNEPTPNAEKKSKLVERLLERGLNTGALEVDGRF